jgi:hypothetical protein
MPISEDQTIQLVIIAVAGLAVVMQAIILLAIFLSIKKTARSLQAQITELRSSVTPMIYSSREFFTRVAPKIEATTDDVAEIVHGWRARGDKLESTATEILGRVQRQTARLDEMLTGVLDSVDRVGGFVTDTVQKPVRQIAGILASIRAVVESLRASAPQAHSTPASGDAETPPGNEG